MGKLYRRGITRDISARQYNQRMFIINKAWNCLSNSEKFLLNKKFDYAQSLESGERKPETEGEKYFVKVCRGQAPPQTDYQHVYLKYLKIRNKFLNIVEAKNVKCDKQINNKISSSPVVKEKSMLEKQQEAAVLSKRRENAEAARRRAQEHLSREIGIPEYEEGTLRSEWGTREDHRKMRACDWGDMQKRRKE